MNLHPLKRPAERPRAPDLSIVVPFYNEREVLPACLQRLEALTARLALSTELVFVDDGSSDGSAELLAAARPQHCELRLLRLSRNFGKEAAMSAGLAATRGAAVVVLDADLQDPPELIPQMLEHWQAGADVVLTDPFLTLGTTLSLVGLALSMEPGAPAGWGWAFFVGLAIGLLAKGLLAVVLVGLPVLAWGLWQGHWQDLWRALPWWRGGLLAAFIAVPWYVAAELKTPGFLDYFLVGEHLRRFIDPGWAGDLYGSAHDEPRGTIWLFLLWASLPWGPVGAVLLGRSLLTPSRRAALRSSLGDSALRLLIPAAFAPALFFSLSGNILWTYVLPGLPFLAILVARGLLPELAHPPKLWALLGAAMAVPLTVTLIGLHFAAHPEQLRSAAPLVDALEALPDGDAAYLYWLGDLPFSARYYSRAGARSIASDELAALADGDHAIFLALRERDLEGLRTRYGPRLEQHYRDARHVLIRLAPAANN